MRKSILAFIATVSIGAASAETYTHTAHANDLTNEQQKSTPPTTQSIQTTTSSPESDNDVDAVYDRFMEVGLKNFGKKLCYLNQEAIRMLKMENILA